MTRRKRMPDKRTTMVNAFPISLAKVISPNPRVDITVRVQ
jgi:hypothetical protein